MPLALPPISAATFSTESQEQPSASAPAIPAASSNNTSHDQERVDSPIQAATPIQALHAQDPPSKQKRSAATARGTCISCQDDFPINLTKNDGFDCTKCYNKKQRKEYAHREHVRASTSASVVPSDSETSSSWARMVQFADIWPTLQQICNFIEPAAQERIDLTIDVDNELENEQSSHSEHRPGFAERILPSVPQEAQGQASDSVDQPPPPTPQAGSSNNSQPDQVETPQTADGLKRKRDASSLIDLTGDAEEPRPKREKGPMRAQISELFKRTSIRNDKAVW